MLSSISEGGRPAVGPVELLVAYCNDKGFDTSPGAPRPWLDFEERAWRDVQKVLRNPELRDTLLKYPQLPVEEIVQQLGGHQPWTQREIDLVSQMEAIFKEPEARRAFRADSGAMRRFQSLLLEMPFTPLADALASMCDSGKAPFKYQADLAILSNSPDSLDRLLKQSRFSEAQSYLSALQSGAPIGDTVRGTAVDDLLRQMFTNTRVSFRRSVQQLSEVEFSRLSELSR